MNRVFDFIRRHLRLFAGLAVVLLAAVVTLAVRASGPAHAAASAPHALSSSSAPGSASTAPNPASHNTFTALAGRSHRPSTAGARPATPTRRGRVAATLTRPSGRRGLRTPAPTPAALSLALRQATGLSPAQVTSRSVCAPAQAGQARCAAEALVLRSNGGLVRPHVHPGATLGRVRPTGRSTVKPATTSSSAPPQADTPAYLEQAYDLSYLSQNEGNGDTVAIVDAYNDPTAQADLNTYRSTYGLPACGAGCFTQVNESGNASPLPATSGSWQVEISLDLDTVSAICPNCHILLVEAKTSSTSDLWRAMQTAANLGADQISDSWTSTSSSAFPASFVPSNVPVVAATGDDGYLGAGEDNYPAALPGVTAAGGTSLASATGNARGFSEGAWSGAGSGCDLNVAKPTWQTDTGCTGRSYADLSADAAPATGLEIYVGGAWQLVGGTSLATPLISSYYALTGVTSGSAQWAYANSGLLNDVTSGSNGSCAIGISYICNAGPGYDGPTGVGSISGDVVAGAPGIGGPSIAAGSGNGSGNSYTEAIRSDGATLTGGIYPNGLDTTWWIDYWPASGGSVQQTPATDIGSGTAPVIVTGYPTQLTPNTTYDYELVAENGDGTTDGYTYSFTTSAASPTTPVASFTSTPTESASGSISFDASGSTDSGATITDYSWDFGDGSSIDDAGATPTAAHQYASPGTYNVTVILTNSAGQKETTTQSVTVFTFAPGQPTPGQPVSFNASSSSHSFGANDTYSWSFVGPAGPNSTTVGATGATPTETFARGAYQVTLTVTDGGGQTATATQTVLVGDPPNATTTTFSPSVTVTQPGTDVDFTATASSPDATAGGSIAGYSWNFGDGSTGTGQDPAHSYANPGVYPVSLTVTDDLGETYTTPTQNVTVDATPTAAFTISPSEANPGGQVSFDPSGSSDSPGTIQTYSWNFGDTGADGPGTSSLEDPAYTYANPGTYTVTLTVTNDAGQSNSVTHTVTVDDPPTATLTPSTALTTPGSAVSFTSTAASPATGGSIAEYTWNFGDGTTVTGTDEDPTHSYASPGAYTVTLTVTDNLGVTATATAHVTVDAVPTPAFTASSNPVTAGSAVAFNAGGSSDSVGTITGYSWNFGDGTTANGQAPSHIYASPGTYTVSLTVTNNAGQSGTRTGTVTVNSVSSPTTPPVTTTPSPAPQPAPVPTTPTPLSASLGGAKNQRLAPALAHGVRVSLSVSQATRASFQVTIPVSQTHLAHARRKPKTRTIVLLQTRAQGVNAGTKAITLKLSRAAARELAGTGPLVLTVKVTLTEASGATISRTVKVTLTR
ncbi:MAG TPA: PKD domain-containing protein [Solirubrobacteraceae bacterium]|nr:PKD domain-containing protein [Solirubrobacteraceae bacterium]